MYWWVVEIAVAPNEVIVDVVAAAADSRPFVVVAGFVALCNVYRKLYSHLVV